MRRIITTILILFSTVCLVEAKSNYDYVTRDLEKNPLKENIKQELVKAHGFGRIQSFKGVRVSGLILYDLWNLANTYYKENGKYMIISSGYRSLEEQVELKKEFEKKGLGYLVAKVGTSEHHLGTTIDVNGYNTNYGWIMNNSYKFGFIQTYTKECEERNGIKQEIWHYRWVGRKKAKEYQKVKHEKCFVDYIKEINKK